MATRNIVPRANNEGKLGTDTKQWNEVNAAYINAGTFAGPLRGKADLAGSADTATKATQDKNGKDITTTYATKEETKLLATKEEIKPLATTADLNNKTHQLKRSTAYEVGDIAYSPNLPSYMYLECVTAGTTGNTEPDFSGVKSGGVRVADGTVTWRPRDARTKHCLAGINFQTLQADSYKGMQQVGIL